MPAIIYPEKMPPETQNSERKVRQALEPIDDIVVFHGVVWRSLANRREAIDGEADFVVLVPHLGLLVLEVKGGGVEIKDGTWYSTDNNGVIHDIKNPFIQASASKYELLRFFKKKYPPQGDGSGLTQRCFFTHGVAFPDITASSHASISDYGHREIIIDQADLLKPRAAIERIFEHSRKNSRFSRDDFHLIIDHLAPTLEIKPLLGNEAADADRALLKLTQEQADLLQGIKRNRKAVILGRAGTGKTVLASEKARELTAGVDGCPTLLLCYNKPLQQYLAANLEGIPVRVETFHGLVGAEAKKAGIETPKEKKKEWYEREAPFLLADAAEKNGTRYDAIIIDEGQDFTRDWVDVLEVFLLRKGGFFYLFADQQQDLYKRGLTIPEDSFVFELTMNCRNTHPIARRVAAIHCDKLSSREKIEGPEPEFIAVDSQEQLVGEVAKLATHLIAQQGIRPSQIAVLSNVNKVIEKVQKIKAGEYSFLRLGQIANSPDTKASSITVDTVHQGKGLEWDAVILALEGDHLITYAEDLRTLAYIGMSRAKSILYVVASLQIKEALPWNAIRG